MTPDQQFNHLVEHAKNNVVGESSVATLVVGLTSISRLPGVTIKPENNDQVFFISRGDIKVKLECTQTEGSSRVTIKHSLA